MPIHLRACLILVLMVASACTRGANNAATDAALADTSGSSITVSPATPPHDTATTRDTGRATPPTPQIPQPLSIPGADTARGVIKVVGTNEVNAVVLEAERGAVSIIGTALSLLRPLTGVEAVIYGRQTSDLDYTAAPRGIPRFITDSFVVRAVDGRPAHDGVIEQTNGQYLLRLTDGGTRQPLVDLPDAVRALVGARVFLVGPVTGPPQAWGVIRR